MNQHKFKAWHIKDKRWIEEFFIRHDGKEISAWVPGLGEECFTVGKDVELVAFTGLKNKKKEEVYDGHITLWMGNTHLVEWVPDMCKFELSLYIDGDLFSSICLQDASDLEIIGHKLENTEFLEGKDEI
ncbi:hypothetical protein KAT92_05225 [Candidatus Babeliales bacterium]|nr:hypothetical protein [Candidatus Babeliales bacterium]